LRPVSNNQREERMGRIVRVTKEFTFEAAHALDGYVGKCMDIHGHSYELKITVKGPVIDDPADVKCGMVIDFKDLKAVVKNDVYELFDHRLILREDSRFKGVEEHDTRVRYVPYQPTCENLLLEIVDILNSKLPENIQLHMVMLRETATSYAEWHQDDN
jgi:6-pyruvoyltetrahydropterin/6-carboxytetrahydropterin synthase